MSPCPQKHLLFVNLFPFRYKWGKYLNSLANKINGLHIKIAVRIVIKVKLGKKVYLWNAKGKSKIYKYLEMRHRTHLWSSLRCCIVFWIGTKDELIIEERSITQAVSIWQSFAITVTIVEVTTYIFLNFYNIIMLYISLYHIIRYMIINQNYT